MDDSGSDNPGPISTFHEGLIEAIPGGFVHVKPDGSIADANAEALRILGMSFDQLTDRYTADFETETIWEDGSPCAIEDYPVSRALITGEPQPAVTIGVRRPAGDVAWAVFRAVPIKSAESGETTGVVVTFLDITARREAEVELQRSRDLLRWSQEIAHVGSWEWDLRTGKVRWTRELHSIYGIPPSEFDGTVEGALAPVHPDDVEALTARTQRILDEGTSQATDYRIIRPDGQVRTVWGDGQILRDERGEPTKVVGAVQDITERRELEEQLRQTQRMDTIGQLAGGVAHDFNNMLQVILGNLELSMQEPGPHEELARVKAAAERGSELTGQLLSFGRRQPVLLTDLDLNDAIAHHMSLVRRMLGERYPLKMELAPDVGVVTCDRTQLDQVLLNLCINARDAMPDGGCIDVRSRLVEVDADFAMSRPWAEADRYAEISVRDEGAGMDEGVRARVFEPFFTTKAVGEGTGLGLSVVYGITQQHGGMVEVDSERGKGSTFRVYLPTVDRPVNTAHSARSTDAPGGEETILVVEDEPMVRALVVGVLTKAGYRVLDAPGGSEALQLFDEHGDEVSLVLSDVVMPHIDGPELVRRLRERRDDLPVLFTSGYAPTEATADAPVLAKPYNANTLLQKVRDTLQN